MSNYKDYVIHKECYNDKKEFQLDKTYELCINELGLQQSKRDQTIAFYIAVVSFAIPAITNMDLNRFAKTAGFIILYLLGSMLAKVIVRYRIYKEIYWVTCRTISQLHNFDQSKLNELLVQHVFYKALHKNMPSVIVFHKNKKGKVDRWRSYLKIRNSAETILYEVLILLSSLVLWVGIFILFPSMIYGIFAATVVTCLNYIYWTTFYYKSLVKVYAVYLGGNDKSFEDTYAKAWFLHSFYQEDLEE